MYNNFFIALIVEILEVLKKDKNFFDLDKTARLKSLENFKLPNTIKEVLSEAQSLELIKEIQSLIEFNKSKKVNSENKLFTAALTYLSDKFVTNIYSLPDNFHYLEYDQQLIVAKKLIKSESRLAQTLIEVVANHSYQEILNELQNLLNKTINAPIVLIQSPISLSTEHKIEIKSKITEQNKTICAPVFQINKKLIGGMRVFVNGEVTDNSWLKKINLITTLKK